MYLLLASVQVASGLTLVSPYEAVNPKEDWYWGTHGIVICNNRLYRLVPISKLGVRLLTTA